MNYIQLKTSVNVTKHPLVEQAYKLCLAIESLPASDNQTLASVEASKLTDLLWCLCEGIFVNEDGTVVYPDEKP